VSQPRAAALLILLALVGAFWLGPVAVYVDLLGTGAERAATAEKKLVRYRALAQDPSDPGATVDLKTVFFPERTDAETVALLQETLKRAAASAQVEIQGIQVLPTESVSGARRIVVRLRGHGDMAGLDRLLYAIDASQPLLYPDNLQLLASSTPTAAAPTSLNFQLDVSGFTAGPT
jgi:hypothetical protein